ncbi:MAG: OB-fold domain-containing protein [Pseudomonadota bacterium]
METRDEQRLEERFLVRSDAGLWALRGGYSETSGQHHFPLAERCPFSGADDVVEMRLPTSGRLEYWTVVRSAPPGYHGPVPYGLGVVVLDGIGLRILTRLSITDEAAIETDAAMHLTTEALPGPEEHELLIWQFAPVESRA